MKIFIPRNISGWWLNMNINIGPATVSIPQLMILAIGLWISLAIRNSLVKAGSSKWAAAVLALPFFLICIFIAFFKYSELTLIPFIAKMIRTHFIDTTKKFQVNRDKPDPKSIALSKSRHTKHDVVIKHKNLLIDDEELNKLRIITEQNQSNPMSLDGS